MASDQPASPRWWRTTAQEPPRRARRHLGLRSWHLIQLRLGPVLTIAVLVAVGVMAVSVVVITIAERHNPNVHSIWSAMRWVALALIASPPWRVSTPAGRIVLYVVDLLRPSSVALLTAALTSHLFGLLVKRTSGMGRTRMKDHIVICGWSAKGTEIIREIRGREDDERNRPIVVLAPVNQNPTHDELTTFVRGDPTEARDLERAGIDRAQTAIVLADNSLENRTVDEMDSKTLLTTLAIEALNPQCYTCVEVIMGKNREHFTRTKADELVVSGHLTGALLAHSAVARGLANVVDGLLTFPAGHEFYWVRVPARMGGMTYRQALAALKDDHDCLVVAIANDGQGYQTNPPGDVVLEEGARLLVIAEHEPFL